MTEYDFSEEGRQRFLASQKRIAKWVHSTKRASAPQLPSQSYSPPPMGSKAFRQDRHPSVAHSHLHHPHALVSHELVYEPILILTGGRKRKWLVLFNGDTVPVDLAGAAPDTILAAFAFTFAFHSPLCVAL
ncbi:hypothetical protein B0H12DRAFT_1328985 [Mycena haematopus]|nr:hypothetical protein B0H12DRAFT_1328985 [Mycena haematopus]